MGITSGKILNASGLPNEVLKDNRYPGSALEEENTLSAQDVAVVTMHLLEDFPEILEITKQTEVNFAGNSIKVLINSYQVWLRVEQEWMG